jgi:hypothetical protein
MPDAEGDSFSAYTERLESLASDQDIRLDRWQRDVVIFRRLTDQVLWEGMLVAVANLWSERRKLVRALRTMGLHEHAYRIGEAVRQAERLGHASRAGLNVEAIQASRPIDTLFERADRAFNDDWRGAWAAAEAYARSNGWSG